MLRLREQYKGFDTEAAELVADSHNVSRGQVTAWVKKKDEIFKAAKRGKDKKQMRARKSRGKFQEAEEAIYQEFTASRKVGKRVGPRWLKQCATRHVRKVYVGTDLEGPAKSFSAQRGWFRRFCKRWNIVLRRKTNVKQKPISERLPKIARYFALFRQRLKNDAGKAGFNCKWGMYLLKNRWSLDQVPAGFFDPTSTYEVKGARRVHIATNGTADSHRECTLQVCIRGFKDESLPRCGQPRLVICFKGQGKRIAKSEIDQYHSDVIIMWDPKAWYNAKKCNEWAVLAAAEIIKKNEGKHLVISDNLHGQTTDEFKTLLKKHCNCDLHLLIAGCTDEIQVVDAGFGALIKHHAQDVSDEWLGIDAHWEEWTSTRMSASRRRILLTQWYGGGYLRACKAFDFVKVFQSCGSAMTVDGSDDDKIKLQGAPADWTWSMEDARRDAVTGEMPGSDAEAPMETNEEEEAAASGAEVEDLSDGEPNAKSDVDSDDSDADTVDDGDPGEYVAEKGWKPVLKYSYKKASDLVNTHFAYKFTHGWERGRITGIEKNTESQDCGLFIVKFPSENHKRCLALNQEDYDVDDIWVQVKRSSK